MKEIDFIPQWYKAGRERRRRCVQRYVLMVAMVILTTGWMFMINGRLSRASAEVEDIQRAFEQAQIRGQRAIQLKDKIAEMKQCTTLLDTIESRTRTTAILGELSHLIGENVILKKLSLQKELIDAPEPKNNAASGAVVKVGVTRQDDRDAVVPARPSQCKVVLSGVAAKPADAAMLIARLEKSPYFNQVVPVYSKQGKVRNKNVTEFEIRCYVADYQYVK